MNDRLPRLISGAFVVLSGFALWEIIQIKGASLIQQPSLASAAAVCCLIAVFLGIAGFLAPHRYWENVLRQWSDLYTNFSRPAQPTHHWLGSVLLSFSMIIYFVVMMKMIPLQPSPENNDQGAFLTQAQAVQASGGPTVLIRQLVSGTYQEANQHPLYVALLSYFPDYESGKRLSAIFGLSALLLFSMGITRQYGTLVGGLTGFFISVNAAYCQLTGRVVCEGLLLFLLAGLWLIVLRLPDFRSGRLPYLHLMGIGILLGLAWLTKGTALLLILGLGLWFCSYAVNWRQLCDRFIRKTTTVDNEVNVKQANATAVPLKTIFVALTLVIVSFAIIAAPLLVRNARVYGSPTFNANSYLMFQDEFTEPHALAKQGSLREAAQAYFKTHSVSEIVKREVKGLLWQVFIFLRSLGPLPFEEGRLFFGVLALPFLIIGLIAETHPARRLYLIWMVLFWVAFAWYLPIAAGERFLMPLLLPALAFISLGIVRVGQLFVQRRTA